MNNKRAMIQNLLNSLSVLEEFHEPPEDVAGQFLTWLDHVGLALEGAGMSAEAKAWNEASSKVRFFTDDSSFYVQMTSMKGLLLGILERVSGDTPPEELFPMSIVEETPGYIQRIAAQANGCYEKGWHDACAVMMRRLIETLLIECFEKHGLEEKIKDNGNYVQLGDLITRFLSESWHLSRNTKNSLPKLKEIKNTGDLSAHNRRFLATRPDIDRIAQDFRIVVQELVYVAGLEKKD